MRRLLLTLAALAALFAPTRAAAWWEKGHETTAAIAMRLVQPRTRAAVAALLRRQRLLQTPTCPARTIEQVSIWPDCVKTLGDRFAYAYAWHFQDVDICRPFDLKAPCAGGNCVSAQIARAQRMVADRALPPRERLMALAFLVHFAGDIHQPLHAAERMADQGGNKLAIDYGDKHDTNLHAFWDGLLTDPAIARAPAGADGILAETTPEQRAAWARGTLEDWSRESWQLARDQAYGAVLADPCAPAPATPIRIDTVTAERLAPIARAQIAKGGVRLARLLDEALDGDHPEVAHPPKPAKPAA